MDFITPTERATFQSHRLSIIAFRFSFHSSAARFSKSPRLYRQFGFGQRSPSK
jgi:hypothetical protein